MYNFTLLLSRQNTNKLPSFAQLPTSRAIRPYSTTTDATLKLSCVVQRLTGSQSTWTWRLLPPISSSGILAIFTTCVLSLLVWLVPCSRCLVLGRAYGMVARRGCSFSFTSRIYSGPAIGSSRSLTSKCVCFL